MSHSSRNWIAVLTAMSVLALPSLIMPKALAEMTVPPASGDTDHPIPGVVQPACPTQAQVPMNRCAGRWRQMTAWLHEQVLDELMNTLLPQEVVQLIDTELAWEDFQSSHCNLISRQVEGGSLYPLVLDNCLARLTNERIAALQAWGETDLSPAAADQNLQAAYQQLVTEMYPFPIPHGPQPALSQRLWETYRQAHCQFEAMKPFDNHEHADQPRDQIEANCRAQLAVERTVHLENLSELGW